MGYLQPILASLRQQRNPAGAPPPWAEHARDAWLIAMPDHFPTQRRAMVAALRDRLMPLADRFDAGTPDREMLTLLRKAPDGTITRTPLRPARFVPLTGQGARAA